MRQYKYQNQQKESEADTTHEQLNLRLGGFQDPLKNRVRTSKKIPIYSAISYSTATEPTLISTKSSAFRKKSK